MSSEKDSYDSRTNKEILSFLPEKNPSREIAYLKNISQMDESNFQFISKQMKSVIKKYKKIKRQLVAMEAKIDQIFKRQEFIVKQTQQTKEFIEDSFEENSNLQNAEQAGKDSKIDSTGLNQANPKKETDTSTEEDPLLWEEEITDDTILFEGENNKETRKITNKRSSADKKREEGQNTKQQSHQLVKAKKLFKKRSYENAISEFQKYRDRYPKGAYYPEATFYIGESFKNLKMPIEAEVFFKEVVESHPQSLWASRAKKNLRE